MAVSRMLRTLRTDALDAMQGRPRTVSEDAPQAPSEGRGAAEPRRGARQLGRLAALRRLGGDRRHRGVGVHGGVLQIIGTDGRDVILAGGGEDRFG